MVKCKSTKQKLNAKSSTKAELIGMSDMSMQVLWTRYFLESLGYKVERNEIYRDNRTCMLLEKNGTISSSQRTRHINIRYILMKDRIDKGEVSVAFCPTEDMIADFFTKILQGKKFIEFKDMIIGIIPVHYPSEERVGICETTKCD